MESRKAVRKSSSTQEAQPPGTPKLKPKAAHPAAPASTSLGRRMAAGALGSCTAEAGTLWLDTVKVRLQVAPKGAPTSLLGMLLFVLRTEGIAGLFGGLTPALLRQASYQSIKMGSFDPVKSSIAKAAGVREGETVPFWILALAGGIAGAIGTVIATPTEIAKVRLQAGAPGGVLGALSALHAENGLLAMWLHPSLVPNVQRSFVVNAAELAAYEYTKTFLTRTLRWRESTGVHVLAAVMSGLCAALASTPVDMAKTRMMNGDCGASMVHCLAEVASSAGLLALYASLFATWARLAPWNVLNFVSLEHYKRLLA
jgi:hypothetical protein